MTASMTMMLLLLIAALLQAPAPAFRSIDRGQQSNIDDAKRVVVRTAAEWTALWRVHAPDRPKPAIDFSREMVVAVFMGSRPTAGFGIALAGVRQEGAGLVVEVRETVPGADAMTAQVITMPYAIAALPARAGEVRFETVP